MELSSQGKVFRCEYCKAPVIQNDIDKGGCICGSRRIRIATSLTEEEVTGLKGKGYEFKEEGWMDEATALAERDVESEVQ